MLVRCARSTRLNRSNLPLILMAKRRIGGSFTLTSCMRGLPTERREAMRVVHAARRFFLEKDLLFRRTIDGLPLKCLSVEEAEKVLQKMQESEHQGWRKLYEQMIQLGYFWPTLEKDA